MKPGGGGAQMEWHTPGLRQGEECVQVLSRLYSFRAQPGPVDRAPPTLASHCMPASHPTCLSPHTFPAGGPNPHAPICLIPHTFPGGPNPHTGIRGGRAGSDWEKLGMRALEGSHLFTALPTPNADMPIYGGRAFTTLVKVRFIGSWTLP